MHLAAKSRNILRALVQAHGTAALKRRIWDREFASGRWKCLETAPGDCVYPFVEKYATNGSILDLGCGTGSTGHELDETKYRDYTGVDISDVALATARQSTVANGRAGSNRYIGGDIFSYVPDRKADVILFKDCIYYIPRGKITGMLDRYAPYLTERGVFVARIAASDRYTAIVDVIERHFDVIERQTFEHPPALVMVFRPPVSLPRLSRE